MSAGHFANMSRLAEQGKLILAGPFAEDPQQWRGLFVFAVSDSEQAKALTACDPVIINGEMVAEYHRWYRSAAPMQAPAIHATLVPPAPGEHWNSKRLVAARRMASARGGSYSTQPGPRTLQPMASSKRFDGDTALAWRG